MISVLSATRSCIPLVLPFLETSLRDSSPNSKSQAAFALLTLAEKFGWSRQMTKDYCMTDAEESRWCMLLFVGRVREVRP